MSVPSQTKNIGIKWEGLTPPQTTCNDKKCPWHGEVKVRGILLVGKVVKDRARRTVVIEREYTVYNRKYMRYERRRSRISVHNPPCIDAKVGDTVLIGETRPLSKTVAFVILGILRKGGS